MYTFEIKASDLGFRGEKSVEIIFYSNLVLRGVHVTS